MNSAHAPRYFFFTTASRRPGGYPPIVPGSPSIGARRLACRIRSPNSQPGPAHADANPVPGADGRSPQPGTEATCKAGCGGDRLQAWRKVYSIAISQVRKNTNQATPRINTASPVEMLKRASTEGPGSAWRASVGVSIIWPCRRVTIVTSFPNVPLVVPANALHHWSKATRNRE